MRYRLSCESCGRSYPVETRHAGGTISCECGAILSIPTMLKIKRLPEWNEETESGKEEAQETTVEEQQAPQAFATDAAAPQSDVSTATSAESSAPKRGLSAKRRGLFCFCAVVLIISLFVVGKNIKQPDPTSVFYKDTIYSLGDGRRIKRDSTPITMRDYGFYFVTNFNDPNLTTYKVDDAFIDAMPPFQSVQFYDFVKELDMSDNFYDNYESIKTQRRIRLGFASVVALLSLAGALYALFAKESTKQVGAMRGADWR